MMTGGVLVFEHVLISLVSGYNESKKYVSLRMYVKKVQPTVGRQRVGDCSKCEDRSFVLSETTQLHSTTADAIRDTKTLDDTLKNHSEDGTILVGQNHQCAAHVK